MTKIEIKKFSDLYDAMYFVERTFEEEDVDKIEILKIHPDLYRVTLEINDGT